VNRPSNPQAARRRYQEPQLRVKRWTVGEPRVIVVHKMRIVGPALRNVLDGKVQVLSQTVFGSAAIALSDLFAPDVVVAGDLLPDGVIEQFLPGLLRSGARVVLLTEDSDATHGLRLLRQGASGIIPLQTSLHAAGEAVLAVARGEAVIPSTLAESLLREWRGAGAVLAHAPATMLTERERQVLAAMGDGMGTKAVARRLGMAVKTAENHKTHIFQKLGVRTHAEAVTLARQANWLFGSEADHELPDSASPGRQLV
jgi:DNA-binding NarL/FixJ family response regulator